MIAKRFIAAVALLLLALPVAAKDIRTLARESGTAFCFGTTIPDDELGEHMTAFGEKLMQQKGSCG